MNIYILLDRSGSMSGNWKETIGSINGYVKSLAGNFNVFMAVFDSLSFDVVRNCRSADWRDVGEEEFTPRGGTPLYDSAARVIWRILDDNADKALFVVMTDGFENNSRYFKQEQVRSMIGELDKKNYETVFLGANFDKVEQQAAFLGKGFDKSLNMTAGNYEAAFRGLSGQTMAYSAGASVAFDEKLKERSTEKK